MKLSVIIVNYNVSCFLEQALLSVFQAMEGIDGEVIVVDNCSSDGSLEMLSDRFPQVHLMANTCNAGFSKANNRAIREARGEYVLLLNPDTIVEADTFSKCVGFMDSTPDAGGLGVKMVNSRGEYLPESKRGVPFPSVAFYKVFGLSKLFPNSQKFGGYYLSHLSNDEVHEVEVLSGAFMMLRRSVLDKTGLLDEDYFMYGEDIDLSYRIIKAGYKNYYFPETRIIHYRGESTKKDSLDYVHVFYRAMRIFAHKHFARGKSRAAGFCINAAIAFRASLSALKRLFDKMLLPLLDFAGIYSGLFVIVKYWESNVFAYKSITYPDYYLSLVVPLYILVWLLSIAVCKGYRKPTQIAEVNKGVAVGTVTILLIYALLPEDLRFSRAITLFGAMWTVIVVNIFRYVHNKTSDGRGIFKRRRERRVAVAGSPEEGARVLGLVKMMERKCVFAGIVTPEPEPETTGNPEVIGDLSRIDDLMAVYRINEVVFCTKDLPLGRIIDLMEQLRGTGADYRTAPAGSDTVIGAHTIFSSHGRYTCRPNALSQRAGRRRKRTYDITVSLLLLLLLPADVWMVDNKRGFLLNLRQVLAGKKTWVSCRGRRPGHETTEELPRPGVLHPADGFKKRQLDDDMARKADILYASDYRMLDDLRIMGRAFRQMGRN